MKITEILFSISLLCSSPFVLSQPLPMRYGKIDTADLKMKVCSMDTSAKAMILCDYGEFDPNSLTFTRHLRLKIFRKEGAWYANQMINTPSKTEIRGCTYNWQDNHVVETKLKDESIFREKVRDNKYRFRVTMPDVRDGSIIELYYSFIGLPMEWRFQELIPVKWSELRIPFSPVFSFHKNLYGFRPLYVNDNWRWVGKDMPAIMEEPCVNSITNYLTKLEIELIQVNLPGSLSIYNRYYSSTWEAVHDFLSTYDNFGMQIGEVGLYMSEEAKSIRTQYSSSEDRMKAACRVVREKITWNDECSAFSTLDLPSAYRNKSGNSADINLSLVKLLKKLDLEVYPVVLSTRENGIISPVFPTIDKFNYVVACVVQDGKKTFLDATEKNLPFGILPERCLNGLGRIIYKDHSDWVDLNASRPEKSVLYGTYTITADGTIQGTSTQTFYYYASLNFRDTYDTYNSVQAYREHLEQQMPGLSVQNLTLSGLDSINLPVQQVLDMTLHNHVDHVGNMISFNPFLTDGMRDMPFREETRKFPVDFAYPRSVKIVHVFEIPSGYQVAEIPKPLNLILPDKKGRFNCQITAEGNTLRLNAQFDVFTTVYDENEYELLRQFYSQVISRESEPVLLQKSGI
jgi:hypothetical protein